MSNRAPVQSNLDSFLGRKKAKTQAESDDTPVKNPPTAEVVRAPIAREKTVEERCRDELAQVDTLKKSALAKKKSAMLQLRAFVKSAEFAKPEAYRALEEVLRTVGTRKTTPKQPFEYKNQDKLQSYLNKARNAYLDALKSLRPEIESVCADLYYRGEVFEKNHFVARAILWDAFQAKRLTVAGAFLFAHMCFMGEGGKESLATAFDLYDALFVDNRIQQNALALYEYAECLYANSRLPTHQSEKAKELHQKAIEVFVLAEQLGSEKATLALTILRKLDDEQDSITPEDEWSQENLDSQIARYQALPHGVLNCLSTVCYQILHQGWKAPETQFYYRVLISLDKQYETDRPKALLHELKRIERDRGTYFDEDIAYDSDSDKEVEYHAGSKSMTANQDDALTILQKLKTTTLTQIKKISQTDFDNAKYDATAKSIVSAYSAVFKFQLGVNRAPEVEANKDQGTVTTHAGAGELDKAMRIVTTPFFVPQTRGLHFFMNKFSAKQVKTTIEKVLHADHPLNKLPIYASAVYEMAGVKTPFTTDPVECHQLEQAARLLTYQMQCLVECDQRFDDLPRELQSVLIEGLENGYMQSHQIYTTSYENYLNKFLPWARDKKLLSTTKIPYVSTGDIQSKHPAAYASGTKVYKENEELRLRPNYDHELRAHRTYVGLVYLMLNPVGDYLVGNHIHVPSLNAEGRLRVNTDIVAERECSFFAKVPEGRLRHIEEIKFPSFHHKKYLKIMSMRYGLDEALYWAFQKALRATKPHDHQRRLLVLLLGEHLSAFKTLYLYKRAHTILKQDNLQMDPNTGKRSYMLYRTLDGGFSFHPEQDQNAQPHGAGESQLLRRLNTHRVSEAVKKRTRREGEESDMSEAPVPYDQDFTDTRTGNGMN